MRKTILLTAVLSLFLPLKTFAFEGPLQYKNQFPLFAHVNSPYLESAAPEDSAGASLSYSSVYLVRNSAAWSAGLDMETAELLLRFRKNFNDSLELGLDLPFLSFNGGFMDGFLDSYHSAFGLPDYGRNGRPQNEFLYEVRRNGALVVKGESGSIGAGDARITAKKTILTGDTAVSVKADLELPTGDARKGYGSGSVDKALSLLIDRRLGGRFKAYLNAGRVFPGDLRGFELVELRDYSFANAGLEAAAFKNVNLLAQLYVEQSPYPKTGIAQIDRAAVLLALGARYASEDNSYELTFTEDPSTSGAPDFSITLGFKKRF